MTNGQTPRQPKIYHIVHVDRLASILADGCLWCDAEIIRRNPPGTTIGMSQIKQRRLQMELDSQPGLHVGQCVPFYFCPRSIMLYLIHCANHPDLNYRGGQSPIIHLEADFLTVTAWAAAHGQRWAFTLSNAGSLYFEDRCNPSQLGEIDWPAVSARNWSNCKDGKQAEFLLEQHFPWHLVDRIGVHSDPVQQQVMQALPPRGHRPLIEVRPDWYY